jgi:hypothetical protein
VYLVTEGVDSCPVRFLPRQCLKHAKKFDGNLLRSLSFCLRVTAPIAASSLTATTVLCMP